MNHICNLWMGDIIIIIIMVSEHHLADMEVVSLLAVTGLTYVVSLIVSPCFFCLLVCSFFIVLGNLLWGILFMCCNQFFQYSCMSSKTGVILKEWHVYGYMYIYKYEYKCLWSKEINVTDLSVLPPITHYEYQFCFHDMYFTLAYMFQKRVFQSLLMKSLLEWIHIYI